MSAPRCFCRLCPLLRSPQGPGNTARAAIGLIWERQPQRPLCPAWAPPGPQHGSSLQPGSPAEPPFFPAHPARAHRRPAPPHSPPCAGGTHGWGTGGMWTASAAQETKGWVVRGKWEGRTSRLLEHPGLPRSPSAWGSFRPPCAPSAQWALLASAPPSPGLASGAPGAPGLSGLLFPAEPSWRSSWTLNLCPLSSPTAPNSGAAPGLLCSAWSALLQAPAPGSPVSSDSQRQLPP